VKTKEGEIMQSQQQVPPARPRSFVGSLARVVAALPVVAVLVVGADRIRLRAPRQGKRAGAGQRPPYKRRGNQLSADKNQRDYALAA